ncbi:hypothetical protein GCM10010195_63760 [Kitasatospora griseola]|nr:hypothetical protein GCM10010195_63760 [Kitasatospora griseola]
MCLASVMVPVVPVGAATAGTVPPATPDPATAAPAAALADSAMNFLRLSSATLTRPSLRLLLMMLFRHLVPNAEHPHAAGATWP